MNDRRGVWCRHVSECVYAKFDASDRSETGTGPPRSSVIRARQESARIRASPRESIRRRDERDERVGRVTIVLSVDNYVPVFVDRSTICAVYRISRRNYKHFIPRFIETFPDFLNHWSLSKHLFDACYFVFRSFYL